MAAPLLPNRLVGDSLLCGNALTVGADSIDVHRIESCRSQKGSGQGRSPAGAAMNEESLVFRELGQTRFQPGVGK